MPDSSGFIAPIHAALIEHGAMNRTLPSPVRPANEAIALAAARVIIPTTSASPGDVLPRTARMNGCYPAVGAAQCPWVSPIDVRHTRLRQTTDEPLAERSALGRLRLGLRGLLFRRVQLRHQVQHWSHRADCFRDDPPVLATMVHVPIQWAHRRHR